MIQEALDACAATAATLSDEEFFEFIENALLEAE